MDRVAIATFIVAAAIALLAAATFRLGSRAQDEIRAQWRPVIAINETKEVARLLGGGFSPVPAMQEAYVANDQLIFAVTNVGRGPALDVTAAWREDKPTAKAAAILRPDEEAVITLTFPEGPPAFGAR